jgi:hypothetical protein
VSADGPEVQRCPNCHERHVAVIQQEGAGAGLVVALPPDPSGEIVTWRTEDGTLLCRFREPAEFIELGQLKQEHRCMPHPHICMTPNCGKPARLFAGGRFCEYCRPDAFVLRR